MESKQYIKMTVTKGDHTFTFNMPVGCTWGTALDAAFDVLQEINALAKKYVDDTRPAGQVNNGDN